VITHTANASAMGNTGGTFSISGGGNPILFKRDAFPYWTVSWVGVSRFNENTWSEWDDHPGGAMRWRHYMMLAHPHQLDAANLMGTWYSLARTAPTPAGTDYWYVSPSGALAARSYEPWPARNWGGAAHATPLQSVAKAKNAGCSQGLIGNISKGADGKYHFFYIDQNPPNPADDREDVAICSGAMFTQHREMFDTVSVNWWLAPTTVLPWWATKIAYYPQFQRWAVFSLCTDATGSADVCLQLSPTSAWTSIIGMAPPTAAVHGLGIGRYFNDGLTKGVMEQFGILKNEYGQLPGNELRIYATERKTPGLGTLFGMDTYSVKVICQ
jgi:hypothetical protein